MNINIGKLRYDLIDYFGIAMFNASLLSIIELLKIEKANDEEIFRIAIENKFDLNEYVIYTKRR